MMSGRLWCCILLTAIPALGWAQQQPKSPQTVSFVEGDQFLVNAPHYWTVGSTSQTLRIPAGFVTDYASIPSRFRGTFERQGRYSRAALIHDYLYWTQTCTRKQADNLFMIAMKESGVPWNDRDPIYQAVRIGGGPAWSSNRSERLAGKPRIVPARYHNLVDGMTWPAARETLFQRGSVTPGSWPMRASALSATLRMFLKGAGLKLPGADQGAGSIAAATRLLS
jgi:hypothetical protein